MVIGGYEWLQVDKDGYGRLWNGKVWLRVVTSGYWWIWLVMDGYGVVISGYRWLLVDINLTNVSNLKRGFPHL